MANYNFVQATNMQLYDDLKRLFPQASPTMLTETIQKHGYHRERCIEELAINCSSRQQHGDAASHNYNQSIGYDHNQPHEHPAGVGPRSQSLSETSTRLSGGGGESFGPPRYTNQNLPPCPLSAPVPSSTHVGSGGARFSYSNNNNNNNPVTSPWSVNESPPSYTSSVTIRPPRPPVPPPTYLTHVPRPHLPVQTSQPPGSPRLAHQPLPGSPRPSPHHQHRQPMLSPTSPSTTRAKSSLNFVPSLPYIPRGSYEPSRPGDVWGAPPPPYGWIPDTPGAVRHYGPDQTHSSTVNLQLGGSTGAGNNGPHVQMSSSGGMVNFGGSSSTSGVPYRSQLHISISPTGGAISASRTASRMQTPCSPPALVYGSRVGSGGSGGATSPPPYAASPLGTLFDEDDPEQERVGQTPLKPVRSPLPGGVSGGRADPMVGAAAASSQAQARIGLDDDAYSRALILHQQQQFRILQDELQKETWHLDEIQKTVDSQERQYFHKHIKYPDRIFFTFEDIQKLRAEVRSLMIDCECLTRVVDVLHKGQVPLGETNEDFYRMIHTGQQGRVLPESCRGPAWPPHQRPPPELLLPPHQSPPPLPSTGASARHTPAVSPIPSAGGRSPQPPGGAGGVKEETEDEDDGPKWECCACTFLNSPAMLMCEICDMPKFGQAQCA